ncbi:MAG: HlyC/CorC family transporter [Anaerolineae bacterium]|nr:HlyC/CorC family transporter [Anaerolineae bacterium]
MHDLLQSTLSSPIFAAAGAEGIEATGTVSALLLYIAIAIGTSFLCSVLEAVLLSVNVSFIESNVETGKSWARLMQFHKANVERPIAAILTLNTFAHTIGAAGAGAEAVAIFGDELFGVITAVLTLMILVFSEIIPKTVGARYWKQLAPSAAYIIRFLVFLLFPLVWLLEQFTKLLGGNGSHAPTVSRAEIEAMARIGVSEGSLLERENRVLRNLLQLNRVHVHDVMTPRPVVLAMQEDTTVQEVVEKHATLPYSRLPIYGESTDDVTGYVLRHDILMCLAQDKDSKTLKSLKRDIFVIPESATVALALDEFVQRKEHISLVIDEYGGTAGILTLEDAIETMLGIEITDESDVVADLRKMAEERYARQQQVLNAVTTTNPGLPTEEEPSEEPTGSPAPETPTE